MSTTSNSTHAFSFFHELRQFQDRVHQDSLHLKDQSQELILRLPKIPTKPISRYILQEIGQLESHCNRIEECTGLSKNSPTASHIHHKSHMTPSLQQLLSTCQMILDENEILLDDCETMMMMSTTCQNQTQEISPTPLASGKAKYSPSTSATMQLYSRSSIYETALNQFRNYDDPMSCNTMAANCYTSYAGGGASRLSADDENDALDNRARTTATETHRSDRFRAYLRNELPVAELLESEEASVDLATEHEEQVEQLSNNNEEQMSSPPPMKKQRLTTTSEEQTTSDQVTPHKQQPDNRKSVLLSTPTLSTMGLSATALQTIGYIDDQYDEQSEESTTTTQKKEQDDNRASVEAFSSAIMNNLVPVFSQQTTKNGSFRLLPVSADELKELPLYLAKQILSLDEFNQWIQRLNDSTTTLSITQNVLVDMFEGMGSNTARNFILVLLKLGRFKGTIRNEDDELTYLIK